MDVCRGGFPQLDPKLGRAWMSHYKIEVMPVPRKKFLLFSLHFGILRILYITILLCKNDAKPC
jgi:hypothetical protein